MNTTLADVNELRMKIQIKSPHVQLNSQVSSGHYTGETFYKRSIAHDTKIPFQILATAEMVSIVQGDLSAVDFVSINHALLPTVTHIRY